MKRASVAALVVAMFPAVVVSDGRSGFASPAAAIPDSPAGRQIAWFVSVLNRGGATEPADIEDHFSPGRVLGSDQIVRRTLLRASAAIAWSRVVRVEEKPGGQVITVWLESETGQSRRVVLTIDPRAGDRIVDIRWLPAEPIAENQIGGRVWDWYHGGPLQGAPVALVDAETGVGFDPPRSCVTDFSGYCQLTLPDDRRPVAVRITYRLLFDSFDTYNLVPTQVFFARASEQAEVDRDLHVVVERNGERREGEWVLTGFEPDRWWWGFSSHFAWGALAVILLLRAPQSRAARTLAWSILLGGIALHGIVGVDYRLTLLCNTIVPVAGAIALPLFLRGLLLFPDEAATRHPSALRACWLAAPGILIVAYGFVVGRLTLLRWDQLNRAGSALLGAIMIALLARSWIRSTPTGRRQIKWAILGLCAAIVAGTAANAISLWDPDLRWITDWSNLLSLLPPICFLIALLRYDLFDVDRIMSASLSYGLVGAALLALGFLTVPRIAATLGSVSGVDPHSAQLAFAAVVAAVVVPVQRTLRPRLERVFFPERHRLDIGMQSLLAEIEGCDKLEEISSLVGNRLTALLRPERCAIYARTGDVFEAIFARGGPVPTAFSCSGTLVAGLCKVPAPVLLGPEVGEGNAPEATPFERAALATLDAAAIVRFRRGSELVAFLCLGTKGSGDIYTPIDAALLAALAHRVSSELARAAERNLLERARELQLRLRRYVPGVVAREVEGGAELEEREAGVSVLFVDIRGYSTYAEPREAEEIFSTLNRYTGAVSRIVQGHGGSVVEFNGDGMMAVFGAPHDLPRKERAAVRAGRDIVDAAEHSTADIGGDRSERLSVGVGIATGKAFVGNIRATDRLIWSAVGNTTNLAARLQALTRELGAAMAVDAATHAAAGDTCADFERHPAVQIRGRSERPDVWVLPLQRS